MSKVMTRRKFMGKTGQAIAVGGTAVYSGSALRHGATRGSANVVNYYEKLGVRPLINAAGTYTVLSASTMPEEVQAAISLASKKPCDSRNCCALRRIPGEALAVRGRPGHGGAASALTLGTAACITRGNADAIVIADWLVADR